MAIQFELFERKSRRTMTVPTIGVQTRGTMSLNAPAFNMLLETAPAGTFKRPEQTHGKQTAKSGDGSDALVEFLYDKASKVIGIRLASEKSLNSYPVRRQPQSESYLVTAKAFLKYYEIPTDTMRRFQARLYDGKVVGFSLVEDELK